MNRKMKPLTDVLLEDAVSKRRAQCLLTTVLVTFALGACTKPAAPVQESASPASSPGEPPSASRDPLALPKGDLDSETLTNYLHAAMDYHRPDEFDKGFNDAALVGRRFKVSIPYEKGQRNPSYYYNASKEEFSVSLYPDSSYGTGQDAPAMEYLTLAKEASYGQPKLEANAFSVTKEVTPVSYRVLGIGTVGGSYIGVLGKFPESTKELTVYRTISKTIKLAPDAARAAAQGLTMDVEGTILKSSDGHAIYCRQSTRGATLDHPYEESWNQCVLSVKLSQIAVRSPGTGVLAQWGAGGKTEGKKNERVTPS